MRTKRNRTIFACCAIALMLAGSPLVGRVLARQAGRAAMANGATAGGGHGNSMISSTVAPNHNTTPRTGAGTVAGQTFTVRPSVLNDLALTPMPTLTPPLATTITVTTTADMVANDGFCSLREAIAAANLNTALGAATGECPAGMAGADTINFSVTGTITLAAGELVIASALTIEGPSAAPLTVSGNNAVRVFNITEGNYDVTLTRLTIANGRVQGAANGTGGDAFGGGILNNSSGTVNITNSTLVGNAAIGGNGTPGGFALGGAIANGFGTLNLVNSTLSGNSATGGSSSGGGEASGGQAIGGFGIGGGIYNVGRLNITSGTLVSNSATGGAASGGTENFVGSGLGGGLYTLNGLSGASSTARNTIIANNTASTADPDVSGPFTSLGFNLISVDPLLGPLANNGGPTQTRAPLTGSPAIDQGNSFGLTTDQRGLPRPQDNPAITDATGGNGADIGAVETQPAPTCPTITAQVSGGGTIRPNQSATITVTVTGGAAPYTVTLNNNGGTLTGNSPLSFILSPQATTTYMVTAGTDTNSCSVTASGSATVTVDATPPTITCPPNQTAVIAGTSGPVTYPAPTVSDNLPGATFTCTPASGSTFALGTTTVNCTAMDAVGNTAACSFTVTLSQSDTTPPTLTCPGNQTSVIVGTSGPVNYPAPTVSDNLPGATFTCTPASGSNFALGTTTVNCTARDAVGNTATCSFTVTVRQPRLVIKDLIAPVRALAPSSLTTAQVNQLLGPLELANTNLERGQTAQACTNLQNFINAVNALTPPLSTAQAQSLISFANQIRAALSCG